MQPSDLAVLDADTWFAAIPAAERAVLLREGQIRTVRSGGRLYGVGDPPNGLWAVLDGEVRLKGYSVNGVELLALILRPGTWFGETSTLDGGPRPHDAVASKATRVLHISMVSFTAAARKEPQLFRHLGILVCQHQRAALDFIAHSVAQPARTRLASILARAASADGHCIRVRQEELAALVGVSRQSLNKHLRGLAEQRLLVVAYGEIRVLDLPGLGAIADS